MSSSEDRYGNKKRYQNAIFREKVKARARRYYEQNKQRVLEVVKKRYQQNKDNPEFMARKREISRASDLKHSERRKHTLSFLGKWIGLDFNPRRRICSQCDKVGYTVIHHIMYDLADPLAYTIELCVKCHRNEPNYGRGPILKPVMMI